MKEFKYIDDYADYLKVVKWMEEDEYIFVKKVYRGASAIYTYVRKTGFFTRDTFTVFYAGEAVD